MILYDPIESRCTESKDSRLMYKNTFYMFYCSAMHITHTNMQSLVNLYGQTPVCANCDALFLSRYWNKQVFEIVRGGMKAKPVAAISSLTDLLSKCN